MLFRAVPDLWPKLTGVETNGHQPNRVAATLADAKPLTGMGLERMIRETEQAYAAGTLPRPPSFDKILGGRGTGGSTG